MSENNNQTPEELAKAEGDAEAEIAEAKPEDGAEAKGTVGAEAKNPEDAEPDYKVKFAESTRENQRILEENKALKASEIELKGNLSKLQVDQDELMRVMESENPDKAQIARLEKSIKDLQSSVLQGKEDNEVGKFLKDHPEAEVVSASLRRLWRLNPAKSIDDVWNENFKPLADKAATTKTEVKTAQKKAQPESGKGSMSTEPASIDVSSPEFQKLPLAQRKEILKKQGF